MPEGASARDDAAQANRYIVGIDLGTTNSAVSYVDTEQADWRVRTFAIPQLVDAGQVESWDTLPSFGYQAATGEFTAGALRLPWSDEDPVRVVGRFAREQGTRAPSRLIASAKSWLCHSGVDRTADLLPWHGAPDVDRQSPVAASAAYLRHIRDAWDAVFPEQRLQDQDIILTLPASFDEVARELTVQAAATAGLPRVILIEEPQAAFYSWIDANPGDWDQRVQPGQKILVCDIGGGTSDFTLIRVRRGEGARVQFHRVAVGEHLILGGDNLDLALAKHIEQRLGGGLDAHQWSVLVRVCRRVKEEVLSDACPAEIGVNLPGAGSKLIGSGLRATVDRDEIRTLLLDGFFPRTELEDRPQRAQSGFQEFGLPYAADPAVTRYLASFLTAHRHAGDEEIEGSEDGRPDERGRAGGADPARPDIVLFNGGVFASPQIRTRLLEVLQGWFHDGDDEWSPVVLENPRLDLAVSRGAAYYGTVRRGRGVRIAAALARTYYIGVDSQPPEAVCLVPGSTEPGQEIELPQRTFQLLVHQPVEFPLYVSSVRLADPPGILLPVDREQMTSLPPIRTVLRTRGKKQAGSISVELHARLSEIGTLELWCSEVGSDRRWRLQFDVRSATQTEMAAVESSGEAEGMIEEEGWQRCEQLIAATFGPDGSGRPAALVKQMVAALEMNRLEWPMSLLRRIWEALMEYEGGRRRSPQHEARWLNLLGYALRPGYGMAVDDWRVAETWRMVQGKLVHGTAECRTESWILWRRVAGGLTAGQQHAVADPMLAIARGWHRKVSGGRGAADVGFSPQQSIEMWRLLGALELLDARAKVDLGDLLAALLSKKSLLPARPAIVWALGRVGSRIPLYGPLNKVPPTDAAWRWLQKLMQTRDAGDVELLAAMQLGRRTSDRHRDLDDNRRNELVDWFQGHDAPNHLVHLVREGGSLDREEQGRVFGEALPAGLRIL